jgi:glycosyltransferase involved in cell wall biosynthesis
MTDDQQPAVEGDQTVTHVPLLSVTVLNYNYARYLPQCLDSILCQTWTDFELLLINDCSTDNSLEVIQPYLADPRVTLINHEKNQGYIASLIEGSERSRSKYLTVISADDFCLSDRAFETLLGMMEPEDEVVLGISAYGAYTDDGARRWIVRPRPESSVRSGVEEYRDLVMENYVLHSGTIIRATAYRSVGGYDPGVRYACDLQLWLMLCVAGKVAYSAVELFAYRHHGTNMSGSVTGFSTSLHEHIHAIDRTIAAMQGMDGISAQLHKRAVKHVIGSFELNSVFSGQLKLAWQAFKCGLWEHPEWTVLQKSTATLMICTVCGTRGYHVLRGVMRQTLGFLPSRHGASKPPLTAVEARH